jgi:hypothetical protein
MIDWFGLLSNSLWVLGLAIALAAFSYISWQASTQNERTLSLLKTPGSLTAFSIAGLLFCAGLAATSDAILEIVIWGVLVVLFLIQIIINARQIKRRTPDLQ